MDIRFVEQYEDSVKWLAELAHKKNLVPIFGAGFSSGCTAHAGTVPDAADATESMREILAETGIPGTTREELSTKNFFEISDLFFENVPWERRASYFEDFYTDVTLFQPQIAFLNEINWPYAYTLNVDDAIEQNAKFHVILPYYSFVRPKTSNRLLYKLHGDARFEINFRYNESNDPECIIFSRTQYMQAITSDENSDIRDSLLSDFVQNHILFIGCSLRDEQDIKYIYAKSKGDQKNTYRITIRDYIPEAQEQSELMRHGINTIVIVKNYEQFYIDFLAEYKECAELQRRDIYKFINPSIIPQTGRDESLNLISGQSIFSEEKNEFYKGALHILRDAFRRIIKELKTDSFVLLKGRRFSGKTFLLCSLADYYKKREVFYFPSTTYVDEETLQTIFSIQKNSLFLFDSNSLTPDTYALLLKYADILRKNGNYSVIAANSNDNNLLTHLECSIVELRNSFSDTEIKSCVKAQDSFGLARRKKGQTNIDYLYILQKDQNINVTISHQGETAYSLKEQSVLIALCALDKLYYSDLIALGVSRKEIIGLQKKLPLLIELIPTDMDEATRHSTEKLVHNSKLALMEIFKRFNTNDISDAICEIVKKYKRDHIRRRLYIEVILFDTINQLFSGRENQVELINKIYSSLQPLLENDLHYWLQRAKSIYRTQISIDSLNTAYGFAKKVLLDGNEALSTKAALTVALISSAIAERDSEKRMGYYFECVTLAYQSVFSEYYFQYPSYLTSELAIGSHSRSEKRIINACQYIMEASPDTEEARKSEEIIKRFRELSSKSKM